MLSLTQHVGVNTTFPPPPPSNNTVTSLATVPAAPPTKTVQFDDSVPTPSEIRRKERRKAREEQRARQHDFSSHESDTSTADESSSHRRQGDRDRRDPGHDRRGSNSSDKNGRRRRSYDESPTSSRSLSPAGSDRTEILPDRFDEEGRIVDSRHEKEEGASDPIAAKIEAVLAGKGTAGKIFKSLTKGLLGDEDEGGKGRDRDRKRRRLGYLQEKNNNDPNHARYLTVETVLSLCSVRHFSKGLLSRLDGIFVWLHWMMTMMMIMMCALDRSNDRPEYNCHCFVKSCLFLPLVQSYRY